MNRQSTGRRGNHE